MQSLNWAYNCPREDTLTRLFVVFLLLTLLCGCGTPLTAPTSTPLPTETAAMLPVPTTMPTTTPSTSPTATATPITFSTDLPSSVAGCNVEPAKGSPERAGWEAARDKAERAKIAEIQGELLFGREVNEYSRDQLPFDYVNVGAPGGQILGCSRSADGEMVGIDVVDDSGHILHFRLKPSASRAYVESDLPYLGGELADFDINSLLEALSRGEEVDVSFSLFENQSGRPRVRPEKMEGWEWARDLLNVSIDDGTPVGMSTSIKRVGDLMKALVIGFSKVDEARQGRILDAAEEIEIPVAAIKYYVRNQQ